MVEKTVKGWDSYLSPLPLLCTGLLLAAFASSLEVDGKEASKLFGFCKQPSSFLLICSAKFLREAQTMKSQDARRRVGNSSWEVCFKAMRKDEE